MNICDLSSCGKAGNCLRCNPLCGDACKRYDPTMQDDSVARAHDGQEAFHVVLWILVSVIFSVYAGMVTAGNFEQLRSAVQAARHFSESFYWASLTVLF